MIAPPIESCPPADTLAAFDTGLIPETELERVADHLGACATCRGALARLSPVPDPLVAAVRRYVRRASVTDRTPAPDAASEFRPTIDFAPTCDVPRGATEPTVDSGTVARSSAAPTADPIHVNLPAGLLAPARGPDELGWLASYRVLREIGRGGMGIVFAAEDTALQRPVALKVMLPRGASDPRNRERFLREARSAAALTHDHIVPVYQVAEDREVMFIAMPLLQGESLQTRLKRDASLPLADVLRVGRETASGLAAAHARGMIHRDIKPDNLWLETSEPASDAGAGAAAFRVKILDFGLARGADDDGLLTNPGGVIGTPAYMAPEQARGEHVDARADVFSLGALLYRVVTGRPAFTGKDVLSILYSVGHTNPPAPHELSASVPPVLSDLVMRMLDKTAANRPTAREVVAALAGMEDALRGAPVPFVAPGPSDPTPTVGSESWLAPSPVRERPRRSWLVTTALGLFALLVAVAGVVVIEIVGRDGKKTKLTVADGSGVTIDKDGNVQVTLPGDAPPVPVRPAPLKLAPPALMELPPVLPKELPYGLVRATYSGANFDKLVSTQPDPVMQWSWAEAQAPNVPARAFSVRWTGFIKAPAAGKWRMVFTTIGGARVWLGGKKIADKWDAAEGETDLVVELTGKPQEVKIEFHGTARRAALLWRWMPAADNVRLVPVPVSVLFPTAARADAATVPAVPRSPDEAHRWTVRGDVAPSTALTFSHDGALAAAANPNGSVSVWVARTGRELEPPLTGGFPAGRPATALAFSPDGRFLVAGGNESTIRVWDLKTGTEAGSWNDFEGGVTSAMFSPDGTKFAACGEAGVVVVRDTAGKRLARWTAPEITQVLGWVSGEHVLVIGTRAVPQLYEAATGAKVREYPPARTAHGLARALVGGRLVVGEPRDPRRLQLVDLDADPAKRVAWEIAAPNAVQAVAVSADGRWAVCAVTEEDHIAKNKQVAWGPADATVLYHLPTGREVHRFVGHIDWVYSLAVSRDGRQVLSSAWDGSVRLWKLPDWLPTGENVIPPTSAPKELPYGLTRATYSGTDFEKFIAAEPDPVMQWAWGTEAQNPDAPENRFSVRWTGFIKAPKPGKYQMRFAAESGVRVWLDGKQLVDAWGRVSAAESVEAELTGKPQEVRIDFQSTTRKASFGWFWRPPSGPERPLPASVLFPTVALAEAAIVPADPRAPNEVYAVQLPGGLPNRSHSR